MFVYLDDHLVMSAHMCVKGHLCEKAVNQMVQHVSPGRDCVCLSKV